MLNVLAGALFIVLLVFFIFLVGDILARILIAIDNWIDE